MQKENEKLMNLELERWVKRNKIKAKDHPVQSKTGYMKRGAGGFENVYKRKQVFDWFNSKEQKL